MNCNEELLSSAPPAPTRGAKERPCGLVLVGRAQALRPRIFYSQDRVSTHNRTMFRRMYRWPVLVILPALTSSDVLAHAGKPYTPVGLWTTWSWEPGIIVSLALSAWLYTRGVRALWRGSVVGRGVRRWQASAFAAGWLALVVALVSPLHPLGAVLFSAHMAQHEILMLVAAPLLVLGKPLLPFLWGLPPLWRRRVGGWGKTLGRQKGWQMLTTPLVAWAVHAGVLWGWHVPSLFQATLANELIHTAQHLSFLLSALLFWWALLQNAPGIMGYGAAVLYVFTTSIHSGALGALLTFSSTLWYPAYARTTAAWGLSPLEDQQLGGLIMWIPAGSVYVIAGLMLFAGWLRQADIRVRRRERQGPLRSDATLWQANL